MVVRPLPPISGGLPTVWISATASRFQAAHIRAGSRPYSIHATRLERRLRTSIPKSSRCSPTSRLFLRTFASDTSKPATSEGAKAAQKKESETDSAASAASSPDEPHSQKQGVTPLTTSSTDSDLDWEEKPNFHIEKFTELPYQNFGVNQHMIIDREFKEVLRQLLWRFRAPIRYAFAYGSGVFPQSKGGTATEAEIKAVHPKAPVAVQKAQDGSPKVIDFIFGVSYTQHWHSLNLMQHRDHYSALGSLGSAAVSYVQDKWGAGVYFNPYVTIDGILIKYGVVNIDTLCRDLSEWDTLYLAGRLHKPVKILRDDPRVRLANQINLLSALRTALLLLPPTFTEQELYATIAGISYLGDPRMAFPTENPKKVANIVNNNMLNFRRLYAPLVESLPNVDYDDPACSKPDWITNTDAVLKIQQDMDPIKRGNMVRRLPKAFRSKLYFEYQKKFQIPQLEFNKMMEENKDEDATSFKRQQGGGFERRIAQDEPESLRQNVRDVIKKTINWPSTTQSIKGVVTAGFSRSIRYLGEKIAKYRESSKPEKDDEKSS
ncbi:mitochondrial matrix Mmp37 [Hypoxylon trugodes]|uniref:mitochondrial matrix Mmp37 n=1 Tax=Hypoxylon trugodes TaxID=326681 RepID=UPI00218DE2EE|nr:mitochondrial matrix Mmp37 [Hypoxylon trugodes]KAI1386593.1 mitochondrial matrix Mmp37 [Hypoxylon trugodes]